MLRVFVALQVAAGAAAQQGEWAGVDESNPTTSLQLRMADGTRMVCACVMA